MREITVTFINHYGARITTGAGKESLDWWLERLGLLLARKIIAGYIIKAPRNDNKERK